MVERKRAGMDPGEFRRLAAKGYNRIPVSRRVPADLETPLSAYLKLAAGPYSFLLESVEGGEKWGRYSIIGLPARTILTVRGHRYVVSRDGEEVETGDAVDPLAFVAEFHARYQVTLSENIAGFQGGLVGYFAYDCVRYVEPRLADCQHPDRLNVPDIVLMVAEGMLVFDNLRGTLDLIILADPAQPRRVGVRAGSTRFPGGATGSTFQVAATAAAFAE